MSLARRHRDKILAQMSTAVAPGDVDGTALPAANASPQATAAAQMAMRLTHDLRRLKEIQSLEKKIEAKREMLPAYGPWIEGLLAAAQENGDVDRGEILPTIMIWSIDVGNFHVGLKLARYVLRHQVPLPARYERQAATLIVEEIAEGALRELGNGKAFPIAILEDLEDFTEDEDMPDEVRAKLFKAIGLEYNRQADAADAQEGADPRAAQGQALAGFVRAQQLHDRIGVKDRIKRLEKVIAKAAAAPPAPTEQEPPAPPAPPEPPEPPTESTDDGAGGN